MQSALLETAGAAGLGGRGSTPSAITVAATFAVARLVLLPPPPRGKTGAAAAIPAACRGDSGSPRGEALARRAAGPRLAARRSSSLPRGGAAGRLRLAARRGCRGGGFQLAARRGPGSPRGGAAACRAGGLRRGPSTPRGGTPDRPAVGLRASERGGGGGERVRGGERASE